MVEFELRGVAGGWDQARYGPSDQVDYVLRADGRAVESYDSVHSFLKLHDLARLERPDHPRFLGFRVHERRDGAGITVEIHGTRVETTYAELEAELAEFLAAVFRELDAGTVGDRREHVDALDRSGEVIADVPTMYDRLVGGE